MPLSGLQPSFSHHACCVCVLILCMSDGIYRISEDNNLVFNTNHVETVLRTLWSGLRPKFLQHFVWCVLILYMSRGTYNLKATLNDRFYEKLHGNFKFWPEIC